jgi:hypothetical protein
VSEVTSCRFHFFAAEVIFGDTLSPRLSHCTGSPCVIGKRPCCRLCRDSRGDINVRGVVSVERFSSTIKAARGIPTIGCEAYSTAIKKYF